MAKKIIALWVLLPALMAFKWATPPGVVSYPGTLELIYIGPQSLPEAHVDEVYKVQANGKYFFTFPRVVIPSIQSMFLLQYTGIEKGEDVLDLGTGTGIQAIFAAQKAHSILATDLGEQAVKNARFNIKWHKLQNKIQVVRGDLFEPVPKDRKFDVIINNIDYPFNKKTQFLWEVHERFFRQVKNYMKPQGRIYYQSGWIENIQRIHNMAFNNGLFITEMHMVSAVAQNREPIVFVIRRMHTRRARED